MKAPRPTAERSPSTLPAGWLRARHRVIEVSSGIRPCWMRPNAPDDIGLYQIAEEAGVPPASTYHFFPTKDAAFLALAQRYLDGFVAASAEPIDAVELKIHCAPSCFTFPMIA